jgi:perosamine synthetase
MTEKYVGTGSAVTRLEQAFARKMGTKYAVAMNSGTATLHATLLAMGIGPGDEVIVPGLGPIMTAAAVIQAGATPVFCDVEPLTFTMDIRGDLWKKLGPNTKAIISVAIYGLPVRLGELWDICQERGIYHIEDNAQCFLGTYQGRLVGKYSHVASYSFEQSKHVNCGEGGIITTDDVVLAQNIRKYANHGYISMTAEGSSLPKNVIQMPGYQRHDRIGWNYRMPESIAELALPRVEELESIVYRRIEIAEMFRGIMKDYRFFSPQVIPKDRTCSYWTVAAVYHEEEAGMSWQDFYELLVKNGGEGPYAGWVVPYNEPAFDQLLRGPEWRGDNCLCAEYLSSRLMQFPNNHATITEAARHVRALRATCEQVHNRRK